MRGIIGLILGEAPPGVDENPIQVGTVKGQCLGNLWELRLDDLRDADVGFLLLLIDDHLHLVNCELHDFLCEHACFDCVVHISD